MPPLPRPPIVLDRVLDVAGKRGLSPSQVALAWILQQEGVTAPIIGTSKLEHLDEAIAALSVELSEAERDYLEELYTPHPVAGIS